MTDMKTMKRKNPVGRPLKYPNVDLLQAAIDAYFAECKETGEPLTVEGLADALEMDRRTLLNYEDRDEFFSTIKKAKGKILRNLVVRSLTGVGNSASTIFNLKNNYGYKDQQDIAVQGDSFEFKFGDTQNM